MTTDDSSLFFSKLTEKFKEESNRNFLQLDDNTLIEHCVFMRRLFRNLIKNDIDAYADSEFCKNDLEKLLSAIILEIAHTLNEMIELQEQKIIDLIIEIFTREL